MEPFHIRVLDPYGDTLDITEVTKGVAAEPAPCSPDSGTRALMRAILHDAILCLQGTAPAVRLSDRAAVASQARCWILSRDATWIFSFESICHVLDIDPDFVRFRVSRLCPTGATVPARYDRRGGRGVFRLFRPVPLHGKQTSGMHGRGLP